MIPSASVIVLALKATAREFGPALNDPSAGAQSLPRFTVSSAHGNGIAEPLSTSIQALGVIRNCLRLSLKLTSASINHAPSTSVERMLRKVAAGAEGGGALPNWRRRLSSSGPSS